MCKIKLISKISSKSVCRNYQNFGEGITNKKRSKSYQEQGQNFSISEDEYFKLQPVGKKQEKSYQFTENQNFSHFNERFNSKESLYIKNASLIERQRVLEQLSLGNAKYLKQNITYQKEIKSSIKNLVNTTYKKNYQSCKNLNTFQDFYASKTSNDQISFQLKQGNSLMPNQNSFSSLGTISEENTQRSQSSQYLPLSEKNSTSSSFNLQENEEITEQSYFGIKARKESRQMLVLISCLVVLTFFYLYLAIVE